MMVMASGPLVPLIMPPGAPTMLIDSMWSKLIGALAPSTRLPSSISGPALTVTTPTAIRLIISPGQHSDRIAAVDFDGDGAGGDVEGIASFEAIDLERFNAGSGDVDGGPGNSRNGQRDARAIDRDRVVTGVPMNASESWLASPSTVSPPATLLKFVTWMAVPPGTVNDPDVALVGV